MGKLTFAQKFKQMKIEKEINQAMATYAVRLKVLKKFAGQNPLTQMDSTTRKEYLQAQSKMTDSDFEINELARVYPSTFRKVASVFQVNK
jgi:hypothetical protein